jgi:hypothetical protein
MQYRRFHASLPDNRIVSPMASPMISLLRTMVLIFHDFQR